MVIDPVSLTYIQNALVTANLVNIDSIIIEPNCVRATTEERDIVLLQLTDVPPMPFGSIGINRIDVFTSRIELAKSAGSFSVDATIEDKNPDQPFVRSLNMIGKGINIEYRCANPATIKAYKTVNDEVVYRVNITSELVSMMHKGQTAMKSDEVAFVCNKTGVTMEISDINSDTLK